MKFKDYLREENLVNEAVITSTILSLIDEVKDIIKLEVQNFKIKRGWKKIEKELGVLNDMLAKEKKRLQAKKDK